MGVPAASLARVLVLAVLLASADRSHAQTRFDADVLRARGINPALSDYFKDAPRFPPGVSTVKLRVNGASRGTVQARFDDAGQLCLDEALLKHAGLVIPDAVCATGGTRVSGTSASYGYRTVFPQTVITLHPNDAAVDLVVPQQALSTPAPDTADYQTGGGAFVLNYDLLGTHNEFADGTSAYRQATLEAGLNLGGWMLRSRHIYSASDGHTEWAPLYTYAAHAWVARRAMVQVGQINMAGPLFSGSSLMGIQVAPESALQTSNRNNGAVAAGIAQTQARVEIRQSGALVYSTLVPPGPFSLTNLPLLNVTSDLNVTVIETNGARHQFIVPASSFQQAQLGAPQGLSFAAGQVRNVGDAVLAKPWLMTASDGFAVSPGLNLQAGAMIASQYYALAGGWSALPLNHTTLTGTVQFATDQHHQQRGVQINASAGARLTDASSLSVSAARRSAGYRDLLDSIQDPATTTLSLFQAEYTASYTWSNQMLGGMTFSYSRSTLRNGEMIAHAVGSWSKIFTRGVTASVSFQRSIGGNAAYAGGNMVYTNVSIPLGSASVSTYTNQTRTRTAYGVRESQIVNDQVNYMASVDRDADNRVTGVTGNLNLLPRYSQLSVGYSRSGTDSTAYSAEMSGALVVHRHGITASPYPVQDTFAIASVGDVAGVKLSTPAGPVWTDWTGRAVLPALPPYRTSRVEVATQTLPRNVDINNGLLTVSPGYAAVPILHFGVVKTRRVLLRATLSNGATVPRGAVIDDQAGTYVTAAADNGTIFLPNTQPKTQLFAELPNQQRCALHFKLSDQPNLNAFFEPATATCTFVK
ncbi:fimbrial biogenesis usher protein [Burkholderia sp. Ac-20344]|uniref:fimbrial biogenesis usher protein n=1 Tax=Burkholderia sp. Ac-20344 TaxID=2703890 RepID=UPI00197C3B23|nr:fimbrial biogenesis usher protein [Burkholderia sp. Ac-20344]MBN3836268.1 fimbrial biogenesis usher protein [Burkholderia sp. Ac-20344]